jgi:hypothetical protein
MKLENVLLNLRNGIWKLIKIRKKKKIKIFSSSKFFFFYYTFLKFNWLIA